MNVLLIIFLVAASVVLSGRFFKADGLTFVTGNSFSFLTAAAAPVTVGISDVNGISLYKIYTKHQIPDVPFGYIISDNFAYVPDMNEAFSVTKNTLQSYVSGWN